MSHARMLPLALLALVLLPPVHAADAPPVLRRAIDAIGGDAGLAKAQSVTVVMVGTQDQRAIAQSYYAEKPSPQRLQETLIVDVPNRRLAFRSEGLWSDDSPSTWRWMITPDAATALKVKTNRVTRMNAAAAAAMYERLRWHLPQQALGDMLARADKLRCGEATTIDAKRHDRCSFETAAGAPFSVLFDHETGLLAGYEYVGTVMSGQHTMRFLFKPYVDSGIGRFPSGYRMLIGDDVYRDLDTLDARVAVDLAEHPWFVPPPADAKPVSIVGQQPAGSADEVAPGIWFLKNVGGYNVMLANVGDCIAVVDAPASYGHSGAAIPFASTPPDLGKQIADRTRELTGKNVCYVIPTHHHGDHFGGIAGLAKAGATILTSPNNEALARTVARTAGVENPKIEIVRDKRTLGSGPSRMDVWLIRNDPHAEEMLFAHFPEPKIAFEGDLSDYVTSAWNWLRFLDRHGIAIEKIYRSHGIKVVAPKDLQWEEPGN